MIVTEAFGDGRALAVSAQPRQYNARIFRSDDGRRRCQRHQVHDAFARRDIEQYKLRHQPHAEKQQVGVVAQVFAEMPKPQVGQQVPRQEGFGQFS